MTKREAITRLLSTIEPQMTSHKIGRKQVLLANDETPSAVTQIAITILTKGERVEEHIHQTMDEHFLFLSGKGIFAIYDKKITCKEGLFLLVPAGTPHYLWANEELKFITIGVATK